MVHGPRTPFPPRPNRYAVRLQLRYRLRGDAEWQAGTTENISRSGILFRAQRAVPQRAALELEVQLPATLSTAPPAVVNCQGRVVREQAGLAGQAAAVAATIENFEFAPLFPAE